MNGLLRAYERTFNGGSNPITINVQPSISTVFQKDVSGDGPSLTPPADYVSVEKPVPQTPSPSPTNVSDLKVCRPPSKLESKRVTFKDEAGGCGRGSSVYPSPVDSAGCGQSNSDVLSTEASLSNDYALTRAFEQLKQNGTDEQKALITTFTSLSKVLMSWPMREWSKSEVKYFYFQTSQSTLDTQTQFSAGVYRFPVYSTFMSIPSGTSNGQRVGDIINLLGLDVQIRLMAYQFYQNSTVAVAQRNYPVKIGLWRQKIAVTTVAAMDTNTAAPLGPASGAYFYFDPLDVVRAGNNINEDTAFHAVHNPHVGARLNNVCEKELIWDPNTYGVANTVAGGVVTDWTMRPSTTGVYDVVTPDPFDHSSRRERGHGGRSRHGNRKGTTTHDSAGEIILRKRFGKGMPVYYADATANPPVANKLYVTLVTDKVPAATLVTQMVYEYAFVGRVWYTDS